MIKRRHRIMTPSTRNGNISCAQLSIDKRFGKGDSFSSRLPQDRDAIFIYATIPSSFVALGRGGREACMQIEYSERFSIL